MAMFCYQCEQTAKGTGCTVKGVCGKEPDVSAMIDLTIYAVKGISMYADRLRKLGIKDHDMDIYVLEALFSTVTNVNFDPERYVPFMRKFTALRDKGRARYEAACRKKGIEADKLSGPAAFVPAEDLAGLIRQADVVSVIKRREKYGDEIAGLQELLMYGLKGMAAYADHAYILGYEDDAVFSFFHEALNFLATEPTDVDHLIKMILRCGEINFKVIELLDSANTSSYGNPIPTKVRVTPIKGKAILVSGHDLKDLEEILKQTEGKGINVYTHGEMLPCHGYPALKKYRHLVGNYGGAWQEQQKEFSEFPGAILMTTNCLQKPRDSYKNRIFTTGLVAWPGVYHIADKNFGPVIETALASEGFAEDVPAKEIIVGFGHNAVLGIADRIVDAVKRKKIRHFFLVGGCDGAKPGRNYYTEFAQKIPKDCVIMTLACGKYRFNKLEFGDVDGIPRLIDCGQCNDTYSAIRVAKALADAFGCSVNELPLSLIISWYEQKAVCILLTLLYLGIRNIRLGPSLPAFITPAVLKVLVEKFNIMPIKTVDEDLKAIQGL